MENVIDVLEDCRFCLMCRHLAPVGHFTRQEALSPHGVALTITSVKRGLIDWNEETIAIVFSEVDGGNCRSHCVNDVPFEAAVAAARADLVAQGMVPAALAAAMAHIEAYETPFAERSPQAAGGSGPVALFVGDEAPHLWPTALDAAMQLLPEAAAAGPVIIGNGRSSGFLPQSAGFPELARTLAQKNIDELIASGAGTLLVLSAGDYFAWQQLYPERLGLTLPDGVEIVELTTFLAQQGLSLNQDTATTVAYVDPTHAVRHPARHDAVRALVTAVAAHSVELFWRRDRAIPVGSTHLQFSDPSLADLLTRSRLADAQSSGATTLLCEDPATLYQLNRFAADYDLQVSGLYETMAAQRS